MLSLPPAPGEQEGYPSRDLQCQGELSPPQPSIQPIKAARQTRHRNYRDTDRTLLRRDHQHVPAWSGCLLWLLWPHLIAVHATANPRHAMQQHSNAKCSAITRPTGVFWLRVWSQVRDGPPAGELTVHRCSLPHASHPLHTHCTAGPFGLACRGCCCRITLHSASVVRLIARPCLARFLSLCPCPCLSPGSGMLLGRLAG